MTRIHEETAPRVGTTDDKGPTLPAFAHRPPMEERDWRPFRFGGLQRVPHWEGPVLRTLRELFPAASGLLSEAVCAKLRELFDESVRLTLDHLQIVSSPNVSKSLSHPTFLAVLSVAPQKPKGLLEVELDLAHAVVDKLLGGEGESSGARALTDIEEGVVSFIVLEALKVLSPNMDPALPRMRLEATLKGREHLATHLDPDAQFVSAVFKMTLGNQGGFVRVFLPVSVLKMASGPRPGPERRARRKLEMAKHLRRLSTVRTWLRAEVGLAGIIGRELTHIRAGDVVVVDELWARPDRGLGGRVDLRIGEGRRGHARGELLPENGRFKVRLGGFFSDDATRHSVQPPPFFPSEQSQDEPTHISSLPKKERKHVSEEGDSMDLLNDIPLQLAVELGRIRVTAEEVAALSVGQVIDLSRGPGDPVELSVQGKIVARGELVEVEGQLGVRILSLLG